MTYKVSSREQVPLVYAALAPLKFSDADRQKYAGRLSDIIDVRRKRWGTDYALSAQQRVQHVMQVSKGLEGAISPEEFFLRALKYPTLFETSTTEMIRNGNGLVKAFGQYGLTYDVLMEIAKDKPFLFTTPGRELIANVNSVLKQFRGEELTGEQYIKACIRRPYLFTRTAKDLLPHITPVLEAFGKYGLTTQQYIHAIASQPSLSEQKPVTVIRYVNTMIHALGKDGITPQVYLEMCVAQPSLFYQNPESLLPKIDMYKKLADQGTLQVKSYNVATVEIDPSLPYAQLFRTLFHAPSLLCISTENIMTRSTAALLTDKPLNSRLLHDRKSKIIGLIEQYVEQLTDHPLPLPSLSMAPFDKPATRIYSGSVQRGEQQLVDLAASGALENKKLETLILRKSMLSLGSSRRNTPQPPTR